MVAGGSGILVFELSFWNIRRISARLHHSLALFVLLASFRHRLKGGMFQMPLTKHVSNASYEVGLDRLWGSVSGIWFALVLLNL